MTTQVRAGQVSLLSVLEELHCQAILLGSYMHILASYPGHVEEDGYEASTLLQPNAQPHLQNHHIWKEAISTLCTLKDSVIMHVGIEH